MYIFESHLYNMNHFYKQNNKKQHKTLPQSLPYPVSKISMS